MSVDDDQRIFPPECYTKRGRLRREVYLSELERLQIELVKLQEWVKATGLRVAVLFEGRDAAGKGGAINRIAEATNHRVVRVVALGPPSDRERTQWYFQRYVAELPADLDWERLSAEMRANRSDQLDLSTRTGRLDWRGSGNVTTRGAASRSMRT